MGLGRLFDLPGAYAPGCILPPLRGCECVVPGKLGSILFGHPGLTSGAIDVPPLRGWCQLQTPAKQYC